jgi:hypothetical protein
LKAVASLEILNDQFRVGAELTVFIECLPVEDGMPAIASEV